MPTDEGWLYVALVLDLFARKLVGWAMSQTMSQELTLAALDVALGLRDPDDKLVHHSDRGSQYAASDYRRRLQARGITVSMSRKGNCWDTQSMMALNVRPGLTRAGTGRAALALTCRPKSGVPRARCRAARL